MVIHIVAYVLLAYLWGIMFPMALLSWFPIQPGTTLASVQSFLWRATEPVLAPVRRLIPPVRAGGMGIDISFLIVFIVLQLLAAALLR